MCGNLEMNFIVSQSILEIHLDTKKYTNSTDTIADALFIQTRVVVQPAAPPGVAGLTAQPLLEAGPTAKPDDTTMPRTHRFPYDTGSI